MYLWGAWASPSVAALIFLAFGFWQNHAIVPLVGRSPTRGRLYPALAVSAQPGLGGSACPVRSVPPR
jgi:hypothetical protein